MTNILYVLHLLLFLLVINIQTADELDLRSLLSGMTEARDATSTSGVSKKLEGSQSAPAVLKVFTQSDIEKYDSVSELLRTVAGITIDDGNFGREYINIRNIHNGLYNNKVLLMINGFKFTDPVGPHFFLEVIPKESIKRLEVIKGPGSVLYGSNAFTGVISIETFDGSGYEKNEWSATLGDYGTRGATAKFFEKNSAERNHFFAMRFYNDHGGERDSELVAREFANTPTNGYTRKLLGNEVMRLYPGDAQDFQLDNENYSFFGRSKLSKFNFSYGRAKIRRDRSYQENNHIPFMGGLYQLLGKKPAPWGDTMFEAGRVRETSDSYQSFLGADYSVQLSEGLSLKVLAKYVDAKESVRNYDYIMFNVDGASSSKEVELQLHHNKLEKVSFVLGYNREWINAHQKSWGSNVRVLSQYLFDEKLTPLAPYDEFDSLPQKSLFTEGIYLQSDWKISERLNFLAANRYNKHEIVGTGYSPKYALVYQLNKAEYLKVIYGKSFRYPSPFELFNNYVPTGFSGDPNLRAEKIESYEYNWTKSFADGRRNLSVTWFDMDLTDYILPRANLNVNLASIKTSKGIEFDYDTKVNDRFTWWTNLSFVDTNEVNEPGVSGGGIWNKLFNFGTDFKAHDNWSFYTASRLIGSRSPRNDGGDPPVSSATTHNVGIKYHHSTDASITLDVINVFDKEYSTSHTTIGSAKMETPPRGRKIFLTYRIKF